VDVFEARRKTQHDTPAMVAEGIEEEKGDPSIITGIKRKERGPNRRGAKKRKRGGGLKTKSQAPRFVKLGRKKKKASDHDHRQQKGKGRLVSQHNKVWELACKRNGKL